MEQLYKELYAQMNIFLNSGKRTPPEGLSVHIPMVGSRYHQQDDIRLLWIGRAINGWDDVNYFRLPIEEYSEKINTLFHDHSRFSWLDGYNYHRSAFWRTCQLVHNSLHSSVVKDWYSDIVWTNLYCVAPAGGGNPNTTLCKAQQLLCGKLLKKQIDLLKPTHIVFVTDWDWFSDFNQPKNANVQHFDKVKNIADSSGVVVGRGKINDSLVVVTRRPEFRFSDDQFAAAIIRAFKETQPEI